jgi:hypothetical protein|tara:strand:- start:5564 stop:5791 length:228 start_codon:yes stop_codon:yes gene_type:complete
MSLWARRVRRLNATTTKKDDSRVPRFRIHIIVSGRILAALGVRALDRGARRRHGAARSVARARSRRRGRDARGAV